MAEHLDAKIRFVFLSFLENETSNCVALKKLEPFTTSLCNAMKLDTKTIMLQFKASIEDYKSDTLIPYETYLKLCHEYIIKPLIESYCSECIEGVNTSYCEPEEPESEITGCLQEPQETTGQEMDARESKENEQEREATGCFDQEIDTAEFKENEYDTFDNLEKSIRELSTTDCHDTDNEAFSSQNKSLSCTEEEMDENLYLDIGDLKLSIKNDQPCGDVFEDQISDKELLSHDNSKPEIETTDNENIHGSERTKVTCDDEILSDDLEPKTDEKSLKLFDCAEEYEQNEQNNDDNRLACDQDNDIERRSSHKCEDDEIHERSDLKDSICSHNEISKTSEVNISELEGLSNDNLISFVEIENPNSFFDSEQDVCHNALYDSSGEEAQEKLEKEIYESGDNKDNEYYSAEALTREDDPRISDSSERKPPDVAEYISFEFVDKVKADFSQRSSKTENTNITFDHSDQPKDFCPTDNDNNSKKSDTKDSSESTVIPVNNKTKFPISMKNVKEGFSKARNIFSRPKTSTGADVVSQSIDVEHIDWELVDNLCWLACKKKFKSLTRQNTSDDPHIDTISLKLWRLFTVYCVSQSKNSTPVMHIEEVNDWILYIYRYFTIETKEMKNRKLSLQEEMVDFEDFLRKIESVASRNNIRLSNLARCLSEIVDEAVNGIVGKGYLIVKHKRKVGVNHGIKRDRSLWCVVSTNSILFFRKDTDRKPEIEIKLSEIIKTEIMDGNEFKLESTTDIFICNAGTIPQCNKRFKEIRTALDCFQKGISNWKLNHVKEQRAERRNERQILREQKEKADLEKEEFQKALDRHKKEAEERGITVERLLAENREKEMAVNQLQREAQVKQEELQRLELEAQEREKDVARLQEIIEKEKANQEEQQRIIDEIKKIKDSELAAEKQIRSRLSEELKNAKKACEEILAEKTKIETRIKEQQDFERKRAQILDTGSHRGKGFLPKASN